MEGPPEIVDGIVMKVMTSCSLRPASRARNPPIAWMPSWEFPAMRITVSEIFGVVGTLPGGIIVVSLMEYSIKSSDRLARTVPQPHGSFNCRLLARLTVSLLNGLSNDYPWRMELPVNALLPDWENFFCPQTARISNCC